MGNDQLICLACTLPDCDEKDKRCFYYVPPPTESERVASLTKEIDLLNQIAEIRRERLNESIADIEARLKDLKVERRRQYLAQYYIDNRDRKLERANDRHRRMREQRCTT